MKATVPNLRATKAGVAHLAVGQVAIGPIHIGQLVLRNTTFGITSGHAQLAGVIVTVRLKFDLEWHVHIGLPWPFDDIDVGDTVGLGTLSIPFAFGDAEIPSLRNINLNIPQLAAANITTTADPVTGLALDAVVAEEIGATDATVPVAGFTLSGFGLGSASIDGVGVPRASVAAATARRVRGAPLQLGALVLRGLTLPNAAANNISSAALDIPLTRAPVSLGADLGLLRVVLKVTPSATAHIDRLLLSGVQARADVGTVEVRNVTLPYEALNITLSDIGIETIDIPTIGVA